MTGRHPSRRALMAWHDGEMDRARAEEIEAHHEACPRCGAIVSEFEAIRAVVRGDAVPAAGREPAVPLTWWRRPVVSRVGPALLAAAVVAAGFIILDRPAPRSEEVAASSSGSGRDEDAAPTADDATPSENPPSGSAAGGGPTDPVAPATPTTSVGPAAGTRNAGETIRLGLVVPDPDAGDGAAAVSAARAAAASATLARPVEIVVADADEPDVVASLTRQGVVALVGGWGPEGVTATIASAGIPWFGPADVVAEGTGGVVPIEVSHLRAGQILGATLAGGGAGSAVVLSSGDDERALADGLQSFLATTPVAVAAGSDCTSQARRAIKARVDVVALAVGPDLVSTCLGVLRASGIDSAVVVPTTAIDTVLEAETESLRVLAVAGAPLPGADGAGARRFREATGVDRGYRALATFVGVELGIEALRRDLSDPLGGFLRGAVYRSDLVTLDPRESPYNRSVRVVELGGSSPSPTDPGASPSPTSVAGETH